jgi:hypothetical protein
MRTHLPIVTLSSTQRAQYSMSPSSSGINVARSTDFAAEFSWLRHLMVSPSRNIDETAFSMEVASLMLLVSNRLPRFILFETVVRTGSVRSSSSSNLCELSIHELAIATSSPSEKICIISPIFRLGRTTQSIDRDTHQSHAREVQECVGCASTVVSQ